MELSPLAWRLKGTDLSKLGKLLDCEPKMETNSKDPRNIEENMIHLLSSWRDALPIGTDIRSLLVDKLQHDFPDEKDYLLRRTQLESMPSYMYTILICDQYSVNAYTE